MFERIKSYFRDVRINLDYPRYERQCQLEHEEQAERMYSTSQLDAERHALQSKIDTQANIKFDDLIRTKREEVSRAQSIIKEKELRLSYFTRYYKNELDELYEKKDYLFSKKSAVYDRKGGLSGAISEAFEEKNKAYEELNYYKNQIDSWHSKSDRTPWLLGNSGKKLPKHSLFGQSFGDLDSYKYDRDSAYDDVNEAKNRIGGLKQEQHTLNSEIAEIKHKIGGLFNEIIQVKKDRSKMYELKKAGYNKKDLQRKLDEIKKTMQKTNIELSNYESQKREYILLEKNRYGVIEIESKIKDIKLKKKQFINSFNLEENQQKRKSVHRKIWLNERNMAYNASTRTK